MHQSGTSLITEIKESIPQSSPQIQRLSQLKNDIIKKMQHIDVLNLMYQDKSQVTFLNTFKKIMDHLSDELKSAVQAYQNIDQQIAQDQKCLFLSKEKEFFQKQRLQMEQVYQKQLNRLKQVRNKNLKLKRIRNQLKSKSFLASQKLSLYQSKNRSLSYQMNRFIQLQNDKKLTESTKYQTSVEKTRINTWISQKKNSFFSNHQNQHNILHYHQFSKTKPNKNQNPQLKINTFFH